MGKPLPVSEHYIDREFTRLVRQKRAERGWSQLQLAVEADVLPSTVSYVEGGGGVTLRNAIPMALALGIDILDI